MVSIAKAKQDAIAAIAEARNRIDGLIAAASVSLTAQQADHLRRSAHRTSAAFEQLLRSMTNNHVLDGGMASTAEYEFPHMEPEVATSFVRGVDAVIADLEHNVLERMERANLEPNDLKRLKRELGEVWGWIVCDLQHPIWLKYPELAPRDD